MAPVGAAIDYQVDDGTIAPTAALSSMPFAPEYSLPAAEAMWKRWPLALMAFLMATTKLLPMLAVPPTDRKTYPFWVDRDYLGIDQGPIVLMIENYRSGFLWNLMKKNPYIVQGLKRAGFEGGWLENKDVQNATKGNAFAA